jgi:multicomponent Na+:H+ antiporter subunit B
VSRRARLAVLAVGLAGFGFLLVWGMTGLPDFGHYQGPYGIVLQKVGVEQRKATDLVSSTTFDYRGFDTMAEEFILFAAATGLVVLLRAQRDEERDRDEAEDHPADRRRHDASDALRAVALPAAGAIVVLGAYVVVHGHRTPGGGFQGGVILAAALLLVYVAGQVLALPTDRPVDLVELTEALAAAAYGLVAVGGLIFASAAVMNFVALGITGHLLSGGTILILEVAVGIEVASALTLILAELLDQALLRST